MEVDLPKVYELPAYAVMLAMFGLVLVAAPGNDAVARNIARPPTPGPKVCSALMPGAPGYKDCVKNWEKSLNCVLPSDSAYYNQVIPMTEAQCKAAGGKVYLPE
jgi:hypothetical protein